MVGRLVYTIRIKPEKLDDVAGFGRLLESHVLKWFDETRTAAGLTKVEVFLDKEVATAFLVVEGHDPKNALDQIMDSDDTDQWLKNEMANFRAGPIKREQLPQVMSWTPPDNGKAHRSSG